MDRDVISIESSGSENPRLFKWAACTLALCAGLFHFSLVTADPDLWGHIRFGQQLWHTGALETVDPYAFTTTGATWVNHEWLAELIFYAVYRMLGDGGLLLGKLCLGLFVVLILSHICSYRQQHPIVYIFIMLTAVMAISPGFMIRPQLATYLLFAIYLLKLHQFFHKPGYGLISLPLMMVLWVNLHGGFLMGIVVVGIVAGWQTVGPLLFKIERDRPLRYLLCIFTATVLASFVNPYGYKLHFFLYQSLSMERTITEWEPVTLLDGSFLAFKLLVLAFMVTPLILRKKFLGWESVLLMVLLYASLKHQRHIPFFAMMVVPYLVYQGSCLVTAVHSRYPQTKLAPVAKLILTVVILMASAYQAVAGIDKYSKANWRIIVDPDVFPVAAVRFMQQNGFKGNIIVPFEWGEYAIWKLYPDCRVSIDGRFRTLYPETVIRDHFQMHNSVAQFTALLERYPAADIVLTRQTAWMSDYIRAKAPGWLYVYSDRIAAIFIHAGPSNQDLVNAFKNKQFIYSRETLSPYFP